jgi:L-asparagine transporter-like permease
LPQWVLALTLLLSMTAVNLMSTRSYGEFEFWFASLKVAAILAFIGIAAAYVAGLRAPHGASFANLWAQGFMPFGVESVLAGVTSVIFALCGPEIATIAAAETPNAAPLIARLTINVALRIALFYIVSIALIVCVVPWRNIESGFSPFTAALQVIHVPFAAAIMNLVVLVAVLSCLNSGLYVTSRVLFILSKHGDAPRSLVALNKRSVPARAILLGSICGYGGVIASIISPQTAFAFLVNASGATMIIIYLIITLAQIRLRRKLEAEAPERLQVRMWLFPWLSYATLIAMVAVLIAMAMIPAHQAEFSASLIFTAIVFACYFARRRSKLFHSTPAA